MTVRVSYNPDVVARLAARGITAQQHSTKDAPSSASSPTSGGGFVLARGPGPRSQGSNTHVVSVRGHVVVTGRQAPASLRAALVPVTPPPISLDRSDRNDSRTSLELIQECDRLRRDNQRLVGATDRLRRDNQRLSAEVTRLRTEIARLPARPDEQRGREPVDLDDAATRFSLLELDL